MNRRPVILSLVIAFTILFFSGCTKDKETVPVPSAQTQTPTQTPTITAEVTPTEAPAPEVENDFVPVQEGVRPFAVMIDNEGVRVLPQGGLNKAQIIYEIIVEGGETRLMPVFFGVDPTMIGPVRSARHYFLDYALEYDAVYVHYGQSPKALSDIKTLKINNINGLYAGKAVFWDLTKDKNNWQDSYTSMEKLKLYTDKLKYRTSTQKDMVFEYNESDVEPSSSDIAQEVELRYSSAYNCGFKFDAQSGMYLRYRKGKPQMERVSGEQLKAKNIVIQIVKTSPIDGDPKGRMEVETTGKGKGYYITDGKKTDITWSKSSRTEPTVYRLKDGTKLRLNSGQTWVQIMPSQGKVTIK